MADSHAEGRAVHADAAPQPPESAVTREQFLTFFTVGLGAMIGAVIGRSRAGGTGFAGGWATGRRLGEATLSAVR